MKASGLFSFAEALDLSPFSFSPNSYKGRYTQITNSCAIGFGFWLAIME
jgi:hypothetical protein